MKKRMQKLFTVMLIISVMMSMMSVGAYASETYYCGLTEHTHTDASGDCYADACKKHVHSDGCYEGDALVCEQETEMDLICGLELHAHEPACEHGHNDSCYHSHENCGHVHSSACCTIEAGTFACDPETCETHTHDQGTCTCDTVAGTLMCKWSNEVDPVLICGYEKGEYDCGKELHPEHTDKCKIEHSHNDGCFEREFVCQLGEHTHTELCTLAVARIVETGALYETLTAAVEDANLSEGADTIEMLQSINFDSETELTITGDITIIGEYVISRGEYTGTLFKVPAGSVLTLDGITIDGNNNWTFLEDEFRKAAADGIRTSNADAKYLVLEEGAPVATGFMITVNGKVVLDGGTVIKNHAGCALFEVSAGATLETNEATITHNTRGGSPVVASVSGDGNWIINEGAVISGNHCEAGNGVVSYMSGTCIMNGGEIYGNTGEDCNGCVMMLYGGKSSFTMNGGHIYDNGATYGSNNGWNPAFYVYGNGAKFTLNDGVIEGNYSESIPGIANNGSNALITLNGGKILNTITGRGFTAKDVYTYAPTVVSNEVNSATNGFYNNVTNTGVLNGDSWFYSNEMTYSGGGTFNGNVTVQSGAETTMMDGSWVNGIVYVKAVGNDSTLTVKPEAVINGIQVRVLNSVESGDCENASEASAAQEAAYVEEDGAKVDSPVLYYHRLTSAQKQNIVVTYDYNGGLDEFGWSGTQVTTENASYIPSVEELSKPFLAGYKLVGWNYAAEDNQDPESLSMAGDEVYYTSGSETAAELTKTIRLIAQWEKIEEDDDDTVITPDGPAGPTVPTTPVTPTTPVVPVDPVDPVEPVEPEPETPAEDPIEEGDIVEIEDPEVPQVDAPEADEEMVIVEEEVPLTDVPKTSDSNNLMLWLAMAALSAIALLTMRLTEKKEY